MYNSQSDFINNSGTAEHYSRPYAAALIARIKNSGHGTTAAELAQVADLLAKVSICHGYEHPELTVLYDVFERFRKHFGFHLSKEELVIFPMYQGQLSMRIGSQKCSDLIQTMLAEHENVRQSLKEMRQLMNNFTVPDKVTDCKLAFRLLSKIDRDVHNHIDLQNDFLFPLITMNENQLN